MTTASQHNQLLLSAAWALTPAGVPDALPPDAPAPVKDSSFVQLVATGEVSCSANDRSTLAALAAGELQTTLRLANDRANEAGTSPVPAVIPRTIAERISFKNARSSPVSDELVLSGRCPVTWLAAYWSAPLPDRWFSGLREIQQDTIDTLLGAATAWEVRKRSEVTAYRHRGHPERQRATQEFEVDAAIAARAEGMTALARGEFTIGVRRPGLRANGIQTKWLTVSLAWTEEVREDLPALPAPKGTVVLQAHASPALIGVLGEYVKTWAYAAAHQSTDEH
jgi:hypothetical protein